MHVPGIDLSTLSPALDAVFGKAQGNVLYRDAQSWKVLAPGTSGNVLTTHGAAANPTWASASGSGGITDLTGDVTATGPGSAAATLASVVAASTVGSAILVPVITYDAKGRITGTTTASIPVLASGTYTPTLFNTTNVAASTVPSAWQWMRVGNVVTLSGDLTIDPTTTGATLLGISLPVASTFVSIGDAAGTAVAPNQTAANAACAAVFADTVNARLSLQWVAVGVANQTWLAQATYVIK